MGIWVIISMVEKMKNKFMLGYIAIILIALILIPNVLAELTTISRSTEKYGVTLNYDFVKKEVDKMRDYVSLKKNSQ